MTRLNVMEARKTFGDTVNRVVYRGERIVLERRGKDVAALVPMEDLALLDQLEDHLDLQAAQEALREAEEKGTIAYETIRADLGLA